MSAMNGARAAAGRKRSLGRKAGALGILLLGVAVGATAVAQSGGEVYTVKKGDTLWDISAAKLGEATQWKRIWEQNPQIKDPHWIYPGDRIQLAGEPAVAVEAPMAGTAPAAPGPEVIRYTRSASTGFLSEHDFEGSGSILSAYHDTGYLYEGLDVFIDRGADDGVRVGDWFVSFRESEPVMHPITHQKAGYRVEETGHLRVVQVGAHSSRAHIERSFSYIQRGDHITPFKPLPDEFVVKPAPEGVTGTILASQDGRIETGREDIVYIDLGREQGVDVGARLAVYDNRVPFEHRKAKDLDLPPNVIGEAVVIRAQGESSTALLTRSTEPVRIGYRVASLADLNHPGSEGAAVSSDPAFAPKRDMRDDSFTIPTSSPPAGTE